MLKGNEIRKLYLDYFKDKHRHTIVESSSLVPDNPTVLLTTAGMLQFLPIFLGIVKPPYNPPRAASCQKCARAGGKDSDIDILIVSDYWKEIDSVITDVVGDIVFDYQELISPHIMSVDSFNNAKDYSFLTNVLEDGVVLV